jgi:hypothetical protein
VSLSQRIREFLGLPMRAGDSWKKDDGSTLTYLGKAPDPWETKRCNVCGGPATQYKTLPPWPGTSYCHTSMTCDDHASYLDGASWGRSGDGEWYETVTTSSCGTCGGPYGECGHTAMYAAMAQAQEAGAVRGRV